LFVQTWHAISINSGTKLIENSRTKLFIYSMHFYFEMSNTIGCGICPIELIRKVSIEWIWCGLKTFQSHHASNKCFIQIFCRSWGIISLTVAYCWQLYTLWILVQLHEAVPGKRYNRYVELAQAAFGKFVCTPSNIFSRLLIITLS
jgi:hypothetical protein